MKKRDLTRGNILKELLLLALPIMSTGFIQMTYNLTDMIWLGRLGAKAVAAIGTAGFFMWFGNAMLYVTKIGAEVGISQSIGAKNKTGIFSYAAASFKLSLLLSFLYAITIFTFSHGLIGFFKLDATVTRMGSDYLKIVSLGLVFFLTNQTITGIFNGQGDSKTPFKINVLGLILNIILDPILIFGLFFFPKMGIKGAAIATTISQFLVFTIFIKEFFKDKHYITIDKLFLKVKKNYYYSIVKVGVPLSFQNMLFSIIAMIVARILSSWGDIPIAVLRIGSQIESISWMTASGISTALGTFVGQNYGAKIYERLKKGYLQALFLMIGVGAVATILFVFYGDLIFKIFIDDPKVIAAGVVYLKILAISQIFMTVEITTQGAFAGIGKSMPPTIVSITFNLLRIPGALILSKVLHDYTGVWWSITLSSVLKGTIITTLFFIYYKNIKNSKPSILNL